MYNSRSTTTPINKDMVESVQLSKNFTHTVFTEREGIDTKLSDITGTWDSNAGKLKLGSKLTQPGIYTGEVTITYKDKTKETHTVTLRKTPSDSLDFTADILIGSIRIDGLKINNGVGNTNYNIPLENVKLNGKSGKMNGTSIEFNIFDLIPNGKLKADQQLDLTVTYGKNNEYTLTSKIVLTEENEQKIREVIATNDKNNNALKSALESSLNGNYTFGTDSAMTLSVPLGANATESYAVKIGNNTMFTYEQSYTSGRQRGGVLNPTINSSGDSISLTVSTPINIAHSSDNNVPVATVSNVASQAPTVGSLEKTKKYFIGDYYFTIGDNTPILYFDATSGLTPVLVSTGSSNQVSGVAFIGSNGSNGLTEAGMNSNSWSTIPGSGLDNIQLNLSTTLEHGYSSIGGMFTVDYTEDHSTINLLNAAISTPANQVTFNPNANGGDANRAVKASIIVVADIFDGINHQAAFERIDDRNGKIVFKGAKDSYKGTVQLVVNGVSYAPSGFGAGAKDLEFTVPVGINDSEIKYSLTVNGASKLTGTVNTGMIEVFDASGSVKNATGDDKVEVVTNVDTNKFKGTVLFDGNENKIVNLSTLANGAHKVEVKTTTGKYQGTYTDTLQLQKSLFTVMVRDPKSVSNSSASLVIDANFPSGFDMSKVTGGVVQYAEKTVNGNTTTWSSFKDSTTKIEKSDVKEEAITKTISGLTSGKTYKFRVLYNYANGTNTQVVYSNESGEVTIQTTGTGTVTGGSGSTTGSITGTGSSGSSSNTTGNAVTTTIQSGSIVAGATTATATLPTGFTFDSNKTPMATGFKYKGKDGKTVVETQEQFKNVQLKFSNGKAEVVGLVPGKTYEEIAFNYTDSNGATKTLVLKDVKTTAGSESEKYLANVYEVVFNRPADETGYHFHYKNLTDKTTALKEFLLNMLTEKEFVETYKTPETKIEALYSAIVARTSDEAGKKFWVEEYKKALTTYGTESLALQAIADRMVNETELKELANRINFKL